MSSLAIQDGDKSEPQSLAARAALGTRYELLGILEEMEARGDSPTREDMQFAARVARRMADAKGPRTRAMGVKLLAMLRGLATKRALDVLKLEQDERQGKGVNVNVGVQVKVVAGDCWEGV